MGSSTSTPRAYRFADEASGLILVGAIVFTPWAFGTTQDWSIGVMNTLGHALGLLLLFKHWIRWQAGFEPPRWSDGPGRRWPVRLLAGLTLLLLGYVLVSALNARGVILVTADADVVDIEPLEAIEWLPHSQDRQTTLRAFWNYLAMALAFWAARDWVVGLSRRERRLPELERHTSASPPQRLRVLAWTTVLSAAALSLVGTLQRLDGTPKLLFLFETRRGPEATFGPFPYRGNAVDYLNLAWPIALALWWAMRRQWLRVSGHASRTGGGVHVLLLPLVGVIAFGVIVSLSRGGFLTLLALMLVCTAILWGTGRLGRSTLIGVCIALVVAGGVGWSLGGEALLQRLKAAQTDELSNRVTIYRTGERMVPEFAPFGSGAETFGKLYGLYREGPSDSCGGYAHNDYLETRVTFGWVGSLLILLTLLTVPLCTRWGSGIPVGRTFVLLWMAALGGMLLHARFDMTFQIYSLHFLFLIVCAVLSCLSPSAD